MQEFFAIGITKGNAFNADEDFWFSEKEYDKCFDIAYQLNYDEDEAYNVYSLELSEMEVAEFLESGELPSGAYNRFAIVETGEYLKKEMRDQRADQRASYSY